MKKLAKTPPNWYDLGMENAQINVLTEEKKLRIRKAIIISVLFVITVLMFFVCWFVGISKMTVKECFEALARRGAKDNGAIIIWTIRFPRVIAAVVAGAGLAVAGLIMQTTLGNVMASPSTLGVSNAAVFGANLSIIGFAGGFLSSGRDLAETVNTFNPFAVSLIAFLFSSLSILLVLALCRIKRFSPNTIVLAGIAIGAIWTAGTTLLQIFATDVGLSAAVVWSFGDLGRVTLTQDYIMLGFVGAAIILFFCLSWRFNAMLGGDNVAKSVGVNVTALRVTGLLVGSLITAMCVSFLGIIGFVGIICPHVVKKLLGHNHVVSIPMTALTGSLLLLFADTIARTIAGGVALPVGAVTSLLGAPFFLFMLFTAKERV
ncbi:MAG: iron ABC transporter permease [Clostridia bacterium]|nr:iron ABC transporter permease [Clostridia bacterium]